MTNSAERNREISFKEFFKIYKWSWGWSSPRLTDKNKIMSFSKVYYFWNIKQKRCYFSKFPRDVIGKFNGSFSYQEKLSSTILAMMENMNQTKKNRSYDLKLQN